MKRILTIITLILFTTLLQAQTTERWSQAYGRYEYYDSSGNLIGYKKKDIYGQWQYYDLRSSNTQSKTYKYPEYQNPYDTGLIERALSIKQQGYNRKLENIQALYKKNENEIAAFLDEIDDSEIWNDKLQRIEKYYRFVGSITSADIDEGYNGLVTYFNDAYIKIRNWRIEARNK